MIGWEVKALQSLGFVRKWSYHRESLLQLGYPVSLCLAALSSSMCADVWRSVRYPHTQGGHLKIEAVGQVLELGFHRPASLLYRYISFILYKDYTNPGSFAIKTRRGSPVGNTPSPYLWLTRSHSITYKLNILRYQCLETAAPYGAFSLCH